MLRFALVASVLAVLSWSVALATAGQQDGDKQAVERFNGTWVVISAEYNGVASKIPAEAAKRSKFTFNGGKFVHDKLTGHLVLATATKTAKRATMKWDPGLKGSPNPKVGFTDHLLYFFVGDDLLVICFNRDANGDGDNPSKEWPTRFATGPQESGKYLQVWQRVKK